MVLDALISLPSKLRSAVRNRVFSSAIERREWYATVADDCQLVIWTCERSQPEHVDVRYLRGACFELLARLDSRLATVPPTVDEDVESTVKELRDRARRRVNTGRLHRADPAAFESIITELHSLEARCRLRAEGLTSPDEEGSIASTPHGEVDA
ncbi:MAG: hypothetical protein R6V31_05965 [Halohasta sp.]